MIRRPVLLPVYGCALRVIALGVPRARRAEWVAEWISELWYVGEAARAQEGFVARHGEIAAFCRGAVEDARCLREHRPAVKASASAVACCVALSVIALITIGLAHVLPGVGRAMRLPMYRGAAHIVTIAPAASSGTVALAAVRSLQHGGRSICLPVLAFYEPVSRPLHIAEGISPVLSVGRASGNFLDVLGVQVWFRQSGASGEPLLMLSEATWRRMFGASPSVLGATVKLGLKRVRLGGVVPDEAAPAGRRFDAWLLLPPGIADGLADATPVFLIGSLEPRSDPALLNQQRWQMSVPVVDGSVDYDCTTLSSPPLATMQIFLFTVFLALLALPATTSLSLGDYPVRPTSLPWMTAVRRWLFLVVKIGDGASGDLLRVDGCDVCGGVVEPVSAGVCAACGFFFGDAVRAALGAAGSEAEVPGVPWEAELPGTGGAAFAELPCMEWHGVDLRGWARVSACARTADELVRDAAVAASRSFLEQSFLRDCVRFGVRWWGVSRG